MADQLNTYSDISAFVVDVFEDAMFVARDNNVMLPLVLGFGDMQGLALRKAQEYNQGTASVIAETDDLSSKGFTPSALSTLTPQEIGNQFFLTDSRIESDPFGAQQDASLELGMVVADKIESDLIGDMASVTGGTVGAAGTAITWGHFFAGLSRLRAQKAPRPYYCVMHPYQWHVLGASAAVGATVTNAPEFQDGLMKDFYVGTVSGVNVFTSANVPIDSEVDATFAIFSPSAIAFDLRRAPRLEPQRDASRRGWELNISAVYANGTWRPKFGIKMIFDAAAPTS